MDPVTMIAGATALLGIGMQLFGTSSAVGIEKQMAATSSQIAGVEQQENFVRFQAMLYMSKAKEMDNLRKQQQLRAQAEAAGVAGGAQYGSGVAGGKAGVSGAANVNALGINQSVQTGTAMYQLSSQQTALQQQYATLQGNLASAQGTQTLGQAFTAGAGPLGNLGGTAYNFASTGLAWGNTPFSRGSFYG